VDPAPFLRGVAWPGTAHVAYPRAKPDDFGRLPFDTWWQAQIPVGVRIELAGDASEVEITYRTRTDKMGPRGDGAGRAFSLWHGGEKAGEEPAVLGEGSLRLAPPPGSEWRPVVVYLPEGMKPEILDVIAFGGSIEPVPPGPRWIAYGDSVAEGWMASGPAMAWPAIASREQALDVVNLGYAGAARGEIVSAEHLADLRADVISITHGTNCWTRIPHSAAMVREGTSAFLEVVRQGHPRTPIVVSSPIVRPDAETTPNRLGATLEDLRAAIEAAVQDRIDAGDGRLHLVPGRDLVAEDQLADEIHPNDDGHRALAVALGPAVAQAAGAGATQGSGA
jgi:lysophospholipase L1-like esterase